MGCFMTPEDFTADIFVIGWIHVRVIYKLGISRSELIELFGVWKDPTTPVTLEFLWHLNKVKDNANIHGRSQSIQLYATSATISGTKFGPETHIASPKINYRIDLQGNVSFWAWLCNYNASQSSITLTGLSMTTFVGYESVFPFIQPTHILYTKIPIGMP